MKTREITRGKKGKARSQNARAEVRRRKGETARNGPARLASKNHDTYYHLFYTVSSTFIVLEFGQ